MGWGSWQKAEEGRKAEILRFANRSPLLFDTGGCAITKSISEIEWRRYGVDDFENSPITVVVSLISPWVPYVSAGKQAITDDEDIIKELRLAIMECGRKLQLHLGAIKREQLGEKRKSIFLRYVPEISDALSKLTGVSKNTIEQKFGLFVQGKISGGKFVEDKVEEVETLGDEKIEG